MSEKPAGVTRGASKPARKAAKAKTSKQAGPRHCIVVLGMHRSGTSALSRIFSMLGCDLPATIMKPDQNNSRGYWESRAISDFNDRLLESAGSAWNDWLDFNPGWATSPAADSHRSEAGELLRAEFGESPLFVLKDPRICRMADFWTSVIEEAGTTVDTVIPVRNPREVAASLERRDGFDKSFGLLLWLRHVLEAEKSSRGRPRVITTFAGMLENWGRFAVRAEEEFGFTFPRRSEKVTAEIDSFITDEARHHTTSDQAVLDNPNVARWVREVYGIMLRWSETGEDPADHEALDAILRDFDESARLFSRLVAKSEERRVDLGRVMETLEETKREREEGRSQISKIEEDRDAAHSERDALSARIEKLQYELATAALEVEQLKELKSTLKEREAESAAAKQRCEALQDELAAAAPAVEQLEELKATLKEREAESAAAKQRYETLQSELAQRSHETEELTGLLSEARRNEGALKGEVARVTAELEARQNAVAAMSEELKSTLKEREAESVAAKQRYEALQSELAQRSHETGELTGRLSEARRNEAVLKDEVARVTAELEEGQRSVAAMAEELKSTRRQLKKLSEKEEERSDLIEQQAADLAEITNLAEARRTELERKTERADTLSRRFAERESELEDLHAKLSEASKAGEAARSQVEAAKHERGALTREVNDRYEEIATLTKLLAEQEQTFRQHAERTVDRSAAVATVNRGILAGLELTAPSYLPARVRTRLKLRALRRLEVFDEAWYLATNPDVAQAGMGGAEHFLIAGAMEGRAPGPGLLGGK